MTMVELFINGQRLLANRCQSESSFCDYSKHPAVITPLYLLLQRGF